MKTSTWTYRNGGSRGRQIYLWFTNYTINITLVKIR